ncbi:Aldo/keto reductase [Tothia fuscella]|uniref:Aldo/keto reductase n=1 Tax=Tothia fuscella TaxID=1048955 RepID=A0A9P4NJH1_9PEZI|nr:Aldo/keto reductase [Tothia fuscella]
MADTLELARKLSPGYADTFWGFCTLWTLEDPPDRTPDKLQTTKEFLNLLPKYGIDEIDTAAVYPGGKSGRSETLPGQMKASESFIIDTKIMVNGGHSPDAGGGDLSKENVRKSFETSLERLGMGKVRVLYCHRPDPVTPLEETAEVFNELYKEGKFERWGVSNYPVSTVKELLSICDSKGFIKPTVYQGMYNILCRHAEIKLFPLLKQHNISYNVYSPTAGGLFAPTQSSRYTPGTPAAAYWGSMYNGNPKMGEAADRVFKLAEREGIPAIELCLRWAVHDSKLRKGDAEGNVEAIKKGPLSKEVVKELDEVWKSVEDVAPGNV